MCEHKEPQFCFSPNEVSSISFYDRSAPIYTQARFLPPSKMIDADVTDSVIGEGCIIKVNESVHYKALFIVEMLMQVLHSSFSMHILGIYTCMRAGLGILGAFLSNQFMLVVSTEL